MNRITEQNKILPCRFAAITHSLIYLIYVYSISCNLINYTLDCFEPYLQLVKMLFICIYQLGLKNAKFCFGHETF